MILGTVRARSQRPNWTELTWPEQVDPVTRRVHWSRASASRLYFVLNARSETRTVSARLVLNTGIAMRTGVGEVEISSVRMLSTSLYVNIIIAIYSFRECCSRCRPQPYDCVVVRFVANPSRRSIPFLLQHWLHGFPGLFTDTSDNIRLYFLVFCFPLFSCWFRAVD